MGFCELKGLLSNGRCKIVLRNKPGDPRTNQVAKASEAASPVLHFGRVSNKLPKNSPTLCAGLLICSACEQRGKRRRRALALMSYKAENGATGTSREIAATTTKTGLTVRCELDENAYAKGVKVSDAEMAALNITADPFHPEWNYTIAPRSTPASI